ncbi:MAG: hypothetical protein PHO83_17575, partial [Geobacteraceae bacterium]|nr:hypothetical protein [Geobacteraceae bacterium]
MVTIERGIPEWKGIESSTAGLDASCYRPCPDEKKQSCPAEAGKGMRSMKGACAPRFFQDILGRTFTIRQNDMKFNTSGPVSNARTGRCTAENYSVMGFYDQFAEG